MPPVLQELMRHSDIKTTMEYYTDRNAKNTGKLLWQQFRAAPGLYDTSYDTSSKNQPAPGRSRTCNLRIRSPLLYPIELRVHRHFSGLMIQGLPRFAIPGPFRQGRDILSSGGMTDHFRQHDAGPGPESPASAFPFASVLLQLPVAIICWW